MSSIYIVQPGMSIGDVVLNATGSLSNWDQILSDNDLLDWTPDLTPGQQIIISDAVAIDDNALRQLQTYPVCNASVQGVYDQIASIFDLLNGNWILQDGTWNGDAVWTAGGLWNTI